MGNVFDALTSRLGTVEERISEPEDTSRETFETDSEEKRERERKKKKKNWSKISYKCGVTIKTVT